MSSHQRRGGSRAAELGLAASSPDRRIGANRSGCRGPRMAGWSPTSFSGASPSIGASVWVASLSSPDKSAS
eukprot:CAMPEP_0170313496 /NCGR_PEP_ID=MMETSP0116_2-20130129/57299_1 /TAXON_ID=400756 /ORGANISM="Durinskia baltica, Strain CSIRO CS-38" /LENGTH=70 /DNA_ID=CAMNT_0010565901 /DNA_START=29 /DNA_END=237 /DNA_ORIENTATION=-